MLDDHGGCKQLFAAGVTELARRAHARRKVFDVWKASGSDVAKAAVERIAGLHAIEATLRDLDDATRDRERQRLLAPAVAAFKP